MRKLLLSFVFALLPTLALAGGVPIADSDGTLQDVSACGSLNCARTTGPTTVTGAGFQAVAGRNDDGTITGTPRTKRIKATAAGRMMVGQPTILWEDNFNAVTQNTAKYRAPVAVQTVIYSNTDFVTLNGSNITTANTNSAYQTYRTFPLAGTGEVRIEMHTLINIAPQANATTEMGLFTATLPGGVIPTDGVFFRWNASAQLRGVYSFNGTEAQTAAITSPSINVNHKYVIVAEEGTVEYWIDDVLQATLSVLTDSPANGQPFIQDALPFTFRHYIGSVGPAAASQPRMSQVNIWTTDPVMSKAWGQQKAGMGLMAYQGQNGGTMGTTALYANSANPTAATPSNTTATLGTGLGGQFWELHSLALGTDGIVSSYMNPLGSATVTSRTLYIFGVCIDSTIQTVLAGGPYGISWSLAFGHTSVSLATSEGATTKAPRRIALGKMVVTAAQAVNTKVDGAPVCARFDHGPVVVAPGEFVAIVTKHETGGTVGTTGTIAHNIWFDAYME